jgi:hypothetical protein
MQLIPQHTEPRRAGSLAVMVLLLILGSSVGIILFANQGSLLGVLVAALVPGFLVGWVLEPTQEPRVSEANGSR